MDIAALGFKIDFAQADSATKSLNDLIAAAEKAQAAASGVTASVKPAATELNNEAAAAKKAQESTSAAADAMKSARNDMTAFGQAIDYAVKQYRNAETAADKYIKKLQDEAVQAGKTAAEIRKMEVESNASAAENAGLSAKAAAIRKLGQEGEVAAKGLGLTRYQLNNIAIQLPDVVQGLLSGQSAQQLLVQQGGQIVQIMGMGPNGVGGVLKALTSPLALTIGGVVGLTAAAVGVAAAMHKGAQEQIAFDNALLLTGNYAASSTQSLYAMADSVAQSMEVTASSVRKVEAQLVSSGRVGSQSLESLTEVVIGYAKATGTDAADATKVFLPLMDDTTSAALKLNEQFHNLTFSQLEQIQTMQEHGDKAAAVKIVLDAMEGTLTKQTENMGYLEQAWRGWGNAISWAMDQLQRWGQSGPVGDIAKADATLTALQKRRNAVQGELDGTNTLIGKASLYGTYGAGADAHVADLKAQLSMLNGQIGAYQQLHDSIVQFNQTQEQNKTLEQQAAAIVIGSQSRITNLKEQEATLQKAIAAGVGDVVKEQASLLEIQKQIFDLEHSRQPGQARAKDPDPFWGFVRKDDQGDFTKLPQRATPTWDQSHWDWRVGQMQNDGVKAILDPKPIYDAWSKGPELLKPLQTAFVGFGDAVSQAMGNAIANSQDLGDAVSQVFRQLEAEYIANKISSIFSSIAKAFGSSGNGNWFMNEMASLFSGKPSANDLPKANALGGVYTSPSLSAYSNGVYNSPQTFAFAKGAGVFAEAGPEAIMPLTRGSDGRLGVASHGGNGGGVIYAPLVQLAPDASGILGEKFVANFNAQMKKNQQDTLAQAKKLFPGWQANLSKYGVA